MKLYESRDFRQLVTLVAAERQVAEAWIEKDYYLTEVLRIIAQVYPTQSMLKGGTSLSRPSGLALAGCDPRFGPRSAPRRRS